MKTRRRRDPQGGFTLVEVMVGFSVLAVGGLALAAVAASTSRSAIQDAARVVMMESLQQRVEEIRGTSPDLVLATYDGQSYDVSASPVAGDDWLIENATIDVTVIEPIPDYLQVMLVASWRIDGITNSETLTTGVYIP